MKTIKLTPAVSNKPCDIQYRLKRAHALAFECRQFLDGIDSTAFEGTTFTEASGLATSLEGLVASLRDTAPQKRVHVKRADKPAPTPKVPGRRGRKPKARPVEAAPVEDSSSSSSPAELTSLDAALNDDLVAAAE